MDIGIYIYRYIHIDTDIDVEINVEIVSWFLDILVNYIFLKFYNDTFSSNCLTEKLRHNLYWHLAKLKC